ncbi:uncharacterized protein MYCFIDRAFT_199957 [Pseudocercospora fijiensis CIRAD86]|uniref:Uncharacterized protein n=1 Tax=Pseudocercospora fijiensis (strain CIRAD86) TaxID=383855 RepID=M2YM94_PSEFD|nr:uncharacterized protein MYCFIDRAFT_199957 [Pseudocercospora fijiensis CIRAD86]EME78855.1 hypothetical protein MYCFIDRAFT_199957 [Pseudocercospora fijiensis CIRAD86]
MPWHISNKLQSNAILLSDSWRVSKDIVIDVKVEWRMSKKGELPKVTVSMEPKYKPGKTASRHYSWRNMYPYSTEYRLDIISLRMTDSGDCIFGCGKFVPDHESSLTAGEIWEQIIGERTYRPMFREYEAELLLTKGNRAAMVRWVW